MSKPAEIELQHLKTAVRYLIGLLEEGSLVPRFETETRMEISQVLQYLLHKVEGLPEGVPENLVQGTAVRALVEAATKYDEATQQEQADALERQMCEAEAWASIHGHQLEPWGQVAGSVMEYQTSCQSCGGFVYINHDSSYNLLLETCERIRQE
ncbi:Phosphoenolpyruvate-protein phosphotransferase of PTS system [hydrothermal vent metagenome]|uniref:Phosphoenolpyruvate-protein phosphotransferase of PTS system n=1 Tax=hydrothermal vent metagenome TaxID=652676 RepID=A0A3B0V2E9_9ZZZZ